MSLIGTFLGGLGLFILGMWLLTDGLKIAAGDMLRDVLARSTQSAPRAVATGVALTATVQSSSAVTVATVGFVNAGLMTLARAVWVIYGSNVGTTTTGWIVALTGVEVRLDSYALPAVGVGMLLRLTGPGTKRAAYGQALAGFAVFLIGIQSLKSGFSGLAATVDLGLLPASGLASVLAYFLVGVVLTFLIQSSSATGALAISASASGLVPIEQAALVMIGADLGTSSTAAFSAIGATANARRAAAGHVVLNAVTALFALLMLEPLLALAGVLQRLLHLPADAGVTVALFGTTFNVVGVALIAPFTGSLVGFLERRFTTREEDQARPHHLDDTLLEVPALAVHGLVLEVRRLGSIAIELARDAANRTAGELPALRRREYALGCLAEHVRTYVGRLNRRELSADVADALPSLLRALQHYEEVADLAVSGNPVEHWPAGPIDELHRSLVANTRSALAAAEVSDAFDIVKLIDAEKLADDLYERLKDTLLRSAAAGSMRVDEMDHLTEEIARLHRTVQRATKAAQRLSPHGPQAT
jgi:phosphate:Na+ symporter